MNYPFDGELFLSQKKRFEEVVFFVHFYDGSKTQMKRHIDLVNDLGFDAFAFNLRSKSAFLINPISRKKVPGIKHIWADQISDLLNLIPQKKIIYSFSNPSSSAIEAMADRNNTDTVAMICDSGPSNQFLGSAFQLFQHLKKDGLIASFTKTIVTPLIWSPYLHSDMHPQLDTFPKGFKILSIRGWKDPLIPPDHIDGTFERHANLDWRKLSLPKAGHLNGLKDFRDEYIAGLKPFLEEVGTPVKKTKLSPTLDG
ncbi:MAG: hypothetical protein B7Y39_06625 [Bdellovibrio sp. 28-41-41]|nr:MAG: hypothetical protein B7Y39_06625 [Bdellovibrio sp. 28-41-41]